MAKVYTNLLELINAPEPVEVHSVIPSKLPRGKVWLYENPEDAEDIKIYIGNAQGNAIELFTSG